MIILVNLSIDVWLTDSPTQEANLVWGDEPFPLAIAPLLINIIIDGLTVDKAWVISTILIYSIISNIGCCSVTFVPEQEYLTQLIIQTAQRTTAWIFQPPHITAEIFSIYPAACLLSRLVQGREIKRDLFSLPCSLPLTDGLGTLLRVVPPSPSFFKSGESLRPIWQTAWTQRRFSSVGHMLLGRKPHTLLLGGSETPVGSERQITVAHAFEIEVDVCTHACPPKRVLHSRPERRGSLYRQRHRLYVLLSLQLLGEYLLSQKHNYSFPVLA